MKSFKPAFFGCNKKIPIQGFRSVRNTNSVFRPLIDLVVISSSNLSDTRRFLHYYQANTSQFQRQHIRLVWIDDASIDGCYRFAQHMLDNIDGSILIGMNSSIGTLGCRNLAGLLSSYEFQQKSKYIMFMDIGQLPQQGWANQFIDFMQYGLFDVAGTTAWGCTYKYVPQIIMKNSVHSIGKTFNYVSGGGSIFKVDVFDKLNGFDYCLANSGFQSQDICMRANNLGLKIGWNISAKIVRVDNLPINLQKQYQSQPVLLNKLKKFQLKWNNKRMPNVRAQWSDSFDKEYE